MAAPLTVGFLGFGEAGSTLAEGLRRGGVTRFAAYDIAWQTPPQSELIAARARRTGTVLVDAPHQLAERADVVVSAVVCTEALAAAESIAPHLRSGQWYLDINSVAPAVKRKAADLVAPAGVDYVDVAVMANVSPRLNDMPLLVAGARAAELPPALLEAGLRATPVAREPGEAARIKMFRSVLVKGIEALVLEAMMASYPYGAHEQVLESFEQSFGRYSFPELAAHLLARHAVHGERRANEMLEVAEALEETGMEPVMARAAYERLSWDTGAGLKEAFADGADPDWRAVLARLHGERVRRERGQDAPAS